MKQKAFFIIVKRLLLKQMKREGEIEGEILT